MFKLLATVGTPGVIRSVPAVSGWHSSIYRSLLFGTILALDQSTLISLGPS